MEQLPARPDPGQGAAAQDASVLQVQARALGDPTRFRLFRLIAEAHAPIGVASLNETFGLNHNAVRQHLSKLVAAGLVTEETARADGPGRPRLVYSVHPSADSRWGVTSPYERLSVLLAELAATGDTAVAVGRRAGLRLRLGHRAISNEPTAALVDAMARQGFDPVAHQEGTEAQVTLRACPFETAVHADARTVCELHLGLARGVAEAIGGIEVTDLAPTDPSEPRCVLRCRLTEGQGTGPTM